MAVTMNDYVKCAIKACPMLLRAPAVVCHDHRREMAGEWAAAGILEDRAKRAAPVPMSSDTDGAREQDAPKYPLAADVSQEGK